MSTPHSNVPNVPAARQQQLRGCMYCTLLSLSSSRRHGDRDQPEQQSQDDAGRALACRGAGDVCARCRSGVGRCVCCAVGRGSLGLEREQFGGSPDACFCPSATFQPCSQASSSRAGRPLARRRRRRLPLSPFRTVAAWSQLERLEASRESQDHSHTTHTLGRGCWS